MQFSITIDNADEDIRVFQDVPGVVSGQVNIYTKRKIELREVDIRLLRDELIDMFDSESGSGLYTNLQKASKVVNSWVVLPERPKAHVLEEGTHQYAFEVGLPAGIDASIKMPSYKLEYFLEARLKYNSFFKPNEVVRIPITLTQVPMSQNLHNDDVATLEISPIPNDCPLSMLRACDVPIGHSLQPRSDLIDQGKPFTLLHLWHDRLAFRMKLPRGRALLAGTAPVVEFETVPIDPNLRFTRVTLALEEVVLMARPQRNAVSKSINVTETHISNPENRRSGESIRRRNTSATLGSSSSDGNWSTTGLNTDGSPRSRRQTNAAASVMSLSSTSSEENKSVFQLRVAHPLVRSKDNKLVGGNTVCRVRDLVATPISLPSTTLSTLQSPTVHFSDTADYGFVAARTRLRIPSLSASQTHLDVRNSHIQVHHQLSYTLEFQKVNNISTAAQQEMAVRERDQPRHLAITEMYNSIGRSHIVRRDDLPDPSALPISDELLSKPRVVRGTLPVSIVPAQLANTWEIAPRSTEEEPLHIFSAEIANRIEDHMDLLSLNDLPAEGMSMVSLAPTEPPSLASTKPAPVEPPMGFPMPYGGEGVAAANGAATGSQPSMPSINPQFATHPSFTSQSSQPPPLPPPIHQTPTVSSMQSHSSYYPARASSPVSVVPTAVDSVSAASPAVQEPAMQPTPLQPVQTMSMPVPIQGSVQASSPIGGFHLSAGFPGPAQAVSAPDHTIQAAMAAAGMGTSMHPMLSFPLAQPPFSQPMPSSPPPLPPTASSVAAGGSSPMFNPMMGNMFSPMQIQQQIMLFQEQQRVQQQMFFQQIAEQYSMFMQNPMMQQQQQQQPPASPTIPQTSVAVAPVVATPQPTLQDLQSSAAAANSEAQPTPPVQSMSPATEASDMSAASSSGSVSAPAVANESTPAVIAVTSAATAAVTAVAPVESPPAESQLSETAVPAETVTPVSPSPARGRVPARNQLNRIIDDSIDYSSPPPDYEEFAMPPPYGH
ncbi:hypothetical protein FBU59_000560 [Linderina macrospora]|uniref:Uncharacterized protein n=1 Tax=Linderina macrospora TaxID=4868 RepID=A0ACC1JGU5_9FUNG|nr:hypothetical protein FBU59_000560 [Linderina macrospora]